MPYISEYQKTQELVRTLIDRKWKAESCSGGWVLIKDGRTFHRLSGAEAKALIQSHKSYTPGLLDAARSSGGIGRYKF